MTDKTTKNSNEGYLTAALLVSSAVLEQSLKLLDQPHIPLSPETKKQVQKMGENALNTLYLPWRLKRERRLHKK